MRLSVTGCPTCRTSICRKLSSAFATSEGTSGLYPQLRLRTTCSATSLMGSSLLCLKVKSGRARDLTKAMTMSEIEASITPLEVNKSASLAQYKERFKTPSATFSSIVSAALEAIHSFSSLSSSDWSVLSASILSIPSFLNQSANFHHEIHKSLIHGGHARYGYCAHHHAKSHRRVNYL